MSYYLDTNFILSAFLADSNSARADAWLAIHPGELLVSVWSEVEIAALLNRRVRTRTLSQAEADAAWFAISTWLLTKAVRLDLNAASGDMALLLASDSSLKLSAPDALHLGLAVAAGATFITFDQRLAEAARLRSHPVVVP